MVANLVTQSVVPEPILCHPEMLDLGSIMDPVSQSLP